MIGGINKMKDEKDLKKVEDTIVKWENPGDKVFGVLIAKEKGANYNNDVFKIKQSDDNIVTVFGTTVLESMMAGIKIGDTVKIVYTGTKENPKSEQHPIKLFEVFN